MGSYSHDGGDDGSGEAVHALRQMAEFRVPVPGGGFAGRGVRVALSAQMKAPVSALRRRCAAQTLQRSWGAQSAVARSPFLKYWRDQRPLLHSSLAMAG